MLSMVSGSYFTTGTKVYRVLWLGTYMVLGCGDVHMIRVYIPPCREYALAERNRIGYLFLIFGNLFLFVGGHTWYKRTTVVALDKKASSLADAYHVHLQLQMPGLGKRPPV